MYIALKLRHDVNPTNRETSNLVYSTETFILYKNKVEIIVNNVGMLCNVIVLHRLRVQRFYNKLQSVLTLYNPEYLRP